MESSGSTTDDDDEEEEEDYNTLLYSLVHHCAEGLPEERNIYVQPGSSPKISTLCHRNERNVSTQPTISYCKVEEKKVCHSGTVQRPTGDIDKLPHNKKTSTLTSEVTNKRNEHLTRVNKSSKKQCNIEVITIGSSDTESESVVEVPVSGNSDGLLHNGKNETLAISIKNKRRFQNWNMGEKGTEQEYIINVDGSDTDCEFVLEAESVPSVSAGSQGAGGSTRKEGRCVMKSSCTKGEDPKTKKKKKKHNKGAKGTYNLGNNSEYISPTSWTPEMQHFYYDSWGGENFDVSELQKTMSDNPADWHVVEADYCPHSRSRFSDRSKKCNNCNSWGHFVKFCPHPKKPTVCMICGMRDHVKQWCPTPMCLNCGAPSIQYIESCKECVVTKKLHLCSRCNKVGHPSNVCPDIWRKYHSVTSSDDFSAACSEIPYKPQRDQWCPNCAQRGHQFHECSLLARKCYTSSRSYNPFKSKSEFTEKKKKKKTKKKKNSLCFQASSEDLSAACSEIRYKPQRDQWCPNCAQRGHQFHECSLLARKCYTASRSYNPFKRKSEFPEKKKKKKKNNNKKRKAKSSSFVSTIVL